MPQKKQKSMLICFIAGIAAMLTGFMLWMDKNPPAETPEKTTIEDAPPPPAPNQPTKAQRDFVEKILLPTIDRAKAHYPVPSIRARFATCMKRISAGQILLQVSATPSPQGGLAGAFKDEKGNLCLLISVPAAMQVLIDSGNDLELFADCMVAMMLHEEYHLIVQGGFRPNEQSFEQLAKTESAAWWFTIEKVYLPMMRAGRLRRFDEAVKKALDAYREANGDRHHPAWIRFSKYATGLKPR